MARKATEYSSSNFGWGSPKRRLRLDEQGFEYEGPDQTVNVRWKDIRALVAAAVSIQDSAERETVMPAIGLALHVPFATPALVDGQLPNLDYAVPIGDLAEGPLRGLSASAEDVFERASEYASAAGVRVIGAPASAE